MNGNTFMYTHNRHVSQGTNGEGVGERGKSEEGQIEGTNWINILIERRLMPPDGRGPARKRTMNAFSDCYSVV